MTTWKTSVWNKSPKKTEKHLWEVFHPHLLTYTTSSHQGVFHVLSAQCSEPSDVWPSVTFGGMSTLPSVSRDPVNEAPSCSTAAAKRSRRLEFERRPRRRVAPWRRNLKTRRVTVTSEEASSRRLPPAAPNHIHLGRRFIVPSPHTLPAWCLL